MWGKVALLALGAVVLWDYFNKDKDEFSSGTGQDDTGSTIRPAAPVPRQRVDATTYPSRPRPPRTPPPHTERINFVRKTWPPRSSNADHQQSPAQRAPRTPSSLISKPELRKQAVEEQWDQRETDWHSREGSSQLEPLRLVPPPHTNVTSGNEALSPRSLPRRQSWTHVPDDAAKLRMQAQEEHEQSREAHSQGRRQERDEHLQRQRVFNKEACDIIFLANNEGKGRAPDEIDLHGLFVQEAKEMVSKAIIKAKKLGFTEVRVIVGKGLHAPAGEPQLGPKLASYIDEELGQSVWKDPQNAGVLVVGHRPRQPHIPQAEKVAADPGAHENIQSLFKDALDSVINEAKERGEQLGWKPSRAARLSWRVAKPPDLAAHPKAATTLYQAEPIARLQTVQVRELAVQGSQHLHAQWTVFNAMQAMNVSVTPEHIIINAFTQIATRYATRVPWSAQEPVLQGRVLTRTYGASTSLSAPSPPTYLNSAPPDMSFPRQPEALSAAPLALLVDVLSGHSELSGTSWFCSI
ncbi:hypothetical protein GGX14DRAFT_405569 [Mycena pura]|uniref:Smr domain-containing protein n=1 Tax=Mycena pura TaxID=153505 RepID=A0AAD6UTI3_9AGAR|nr:hypothetical protein GGX14DRAFT_405569 [Mycena pura]